MLKTILAAVSLLAVAALPAFAANESPKVNDVLDQMFEKPHISNLEPGTELVYRFARKPSDEKILGTAFEDDIKVKIESNAEKEGKKNVRIDIYSGDRARDPHRITDMDGNPLLVVYLDNAVAHFRQVAGGDRDYLKNTMKRAMCKANVERVSINYKGETVPGVRLVITPYKNDPSRNKMRGFEGAKFSIVVSDKIPGVFAKMISDYSNSDKQAPSLYETTTLQGVEEVK